MKGEKTQEQQGNGIYNSRLKALIPLTFRGQALLFLFPMIVIISMVYTLESVSTERKILRKEIIKQGETIATIAARTAELPLLSENLEQLKSSALTVMQIKDITYVSFLNNRSQILFHEGRQHPVAGVLTATPDGAISFSEHDDVFEFNVPVITVKAAEGLYLLDGTSSAPLVKEQIGWVSIGLSKEVMSRSEHEIMVRGAILALIFSLAGVLLLYLFITLATRPLYALINALNEISKGAHPEVHVMSPRSEIGRLTEEFNRMSRAIQEREEALQENVVELELTQTELQDNVQELEQQIDAREQVEAELIAKIDELQRTKTALLQSEKKFRGIFDQTFQLMGVLSPDGTLLEVNQTALGFCEESEADVVGKLFWDTTWWKFSAELQEKVRAAVTRAAAGELVRFETNHLYGGKLYDIDFSLKPVMDEQGKVVFLIPEGRDITGMKKLEKDLRQSQKMEAIGTLAGGIAHDFNNILTAIIGYTDLAQGKLVDNNLAARHLERAQEASLRAKELVSRILTFSRQSEQEREPVHMATIIDEVLRLLRSSLPTTIEIHRQISTTRNGDMVLADPTQIHQVLMNLGTNAAHAMREHGGVLDISLSDFNVDAALMALHPQLSPGPCLRLTVSDTGHGMESHIKERIFDPYFTTKKVGEGTGMGLAVVHGIVRSYGGEISVYSEPGQGTTFHIFLPKFFGEEEVPVTETCLPGGGTERILFVDDEPMLAELGQELLQSLGYHVTTAMNGREALHLFRTTPQAFDMVITDMTMPGITGKELAMELLVVRPDIPVILCTGFHELINEKQAKETGIREFIMKPYAIKNLDMTIRKVLQSDHV
jgi:PAS domain S-box-containing protein